MHIFFDETWNKLRAGLPDFDDSRPFIHRFAGMAKVVSQVMGLLKNKGLDRSTFGQCCRLAQTLSHDE